MAEVKIEVLTSPTCPFCPQALRVARELSKEKAGIKVIETSTGTKDGSRRAEQNKVRSVPTLFIKGSAFPDRIGYVGVPAKEKLAKMVNIALGEEEWIEEKKESIFSRLSKIKIKL